MNEHHPPVKGLEYNYIDFGIYIGTNFCCQTHFDEKLLNKKIEVDISLEETRIDKPFGIKFYVWLPVKNDEAPSEDQLEFGIAVIEKSIEMKKKIYIHCQNGHGRAPTLVAAYLIKEGKKFEEAIDFIKTKRPTTHLHERQILALKKFQEKFINK